MIDLRFRPFDVVPRAPKGGRRRATFSASWTSTLNDLERELDHLKARDIVIEAETTREQIRNDGWPYSNAKMGPTVAISFESKHGPMRYECGTFTHWNDNIRAIGLTLSSLRAVDRYGATHSAEQYRGFAALPPTPAAEWASPEHAAQWLRSIAGVDNPLVSPKDLYRAAARVAHPDAGGTNELMAKVSRAMEFMITGSHT